MNTIETCIANTAIDLQNERLTKESLEKIAIQLNSDYIPITIEHDPRKPPVGRFISGHMQERADGEWEVIAKGEMFEVNEEIPFIANSRSIPLKKFDNEYVHVTYDWNFRDPTDQSDIRTLDEVLNSKAGYSAKKALAPLGVLEIAGIFLLGGIASGFLNKVGSDAWDKFLTTMKRLLGRRKADEKERLLSFEAVVSEGECHMYIEVILTNPTADEIEEFFTTGLSKLDDVSSHIFDGSGKVAKAVLEYKDSKYKILYGIRRDSVPMHFADIRNVPNESIQPTAKSGG